MGIPNITRPCAFVFVRSGERVLISEMFDEEEGLFYRPAGGGIEFGETSHQAARRELREELDLDTDELVLLGVLENLFSFRGAPHHEICFVFETWVRDDQLDRLDGAPIVETAGVDVEIARVFERGAIGDDVAPVYPECVEGLLSSEASS